MIVNTSKPYPIYIERSCLSILGEEAKKLFPKATRAVIVSDSNVAPLYAKQVSELLIAAGFLVTVFSFPAGEESKKLSTVSDIYAHFAENTLTRGDFAVALGGGVTGDMLGFAAATFLRGIDFIQIPTSLLAQVDSSVGGKTGVDLAAGKNLVGAFHQPKLVLIDPSTLETLPESFFADGMGEVIKYGAIRSLPLFELIQKNDLKHNPLMLEKVIYDCVDIKRQIVENDEFDTGERMLLNFGHTFGHALEKHYHFGKYSHGEAIGIGMVMLAGVGEKHNLTLPGTAEKIIDILKQYNLPTADEANLNDLIAHTAIDKKNIGSQLNLVLLRRIGDSFLHKISYSEMKSFMEEDL